MKTSLVKSVLLGLLPAAALADFCERVKPDLVLPTHEWPVGRCVDELVKLLESRGVI